MPTPEELARTEAETKKTLEMFEALVRKNEEFERQKDEYERRNGVSFDAFSEQISQESERQKQFMTPAQKEAIEKEEAEFEAELARDIAEAENRHKLEKGQSTTPKRIRRMGNMI